MSGEPLLPDLGLNPCKAPVCEQAGSSSRARISRPGKCFIPTRAEANRRRGEKTAFITYQRAASRRIICRSAARLVALERERERGETGGGDKDSTSCAKTSEAAAQSQSTYEELEGELGTEDKKKKAWKKYEEEGTVRCKMS